MGLFERMTSVFKGRAHEHADADVGGPMEVSMAKSTALLDKLSVAMADVTAGRMRLDIQVEKLQGVADGLEAQAKQALAQGREDIARSALVRKTGVTQQVAAITAQRDTLRAELEKMTLTDQRLRARLDAFRAQKETIEAQYSAAEAQVKVNEAVSGLSEDMADMNAAAAKAEDRMQTMQARSEAIDELIRSGSLEDLSAPDTVGAGLPAADEATAVDGELERLKQEIGAGGTGIQKGGTT